MADMTPYLEHVKFKHANWGDTVQVCHIEPNFSPWMDEDYDDYPPWALNLVVGLNGAGKTTLLKCIEWACNENRPLKGTSLDDFTQRLALHQVEYFEIAVSYYTELYPYRGLTNIAFDLYGDEITKEFHNSGGKAGSDDTHGVACMDWFHEDGELWDHFMMSSPERIKITFVSKFDIKNNHVELEIIPDIEHPHFVGFRLLDGEVVKTSFDQISNETVSVPPVALPGEAIYPHMDAGELFALIEKNLQRLGLDFELPNVEYPKQYPRTHRIESKAVFEIDENDKQSLMLLENEDELKKILEKMTAFEIEKKFKIAKNKFPVYDHSKPNPEQPIENQGSLLVQPGSGYCFEGSRRLNVPRPSTADLLEFLNRNPRTFHPSTFDNETDTQWTGSEGSPTNVRSNVFFNYDKQKLIQFIRGKFCEIPGSTKFLIEKLFGINQAIISSLNVVKQLSPSYKFGGYLTDGQARLASITHEILTQKYEILLIDEPETSMHIDWQRRIVDKITNESMFRDNPQDNDDWDPWTTFSHIFITTHSPDVILDHLEMVSELVPQHSDVYQP